MFEIVKAIHEAIHTESTLAFVLSIALSFGVVAGGVAWIVDRGYQNTLAERQIERKLTDWQKTKIKSNLSRFVGSKMVILASEGIDTHEYAKQFRAVFEKTGWKVKGPLDAPVSAAIVDIQLSVNYAYFGDAPVPDAFSTLQGTLQFLGIRCRDRLVMDPNVPIDVVVLLVGGKGTIPAGNYPPVSVEGINIPDDF